MPYTTISGTLQGVQDQLNGALVLGPFPASGLPVGTLTIIFTQPGAETVTFTGAANEVRTVDQIVTEINADLTANPATIRGVDSSNYPSSSVYVEGRGMVKEKYLYIVLQDDTSGITITGGTARALLKMATPATIALTPVPAAEVVAFGPDSTASHYVALVAP